MQSLPDLSALIAKSPYLAHSGMHVVSSDPDVGKVVMRLPLREDLCRDAAGTQFHGGVISAFADSAGDCAVALKVGGPVPTINMRIDYLRPATGSSLMAVAMVRKCGRTVAVADVEISDANDKLVAIGRITYSASIG